MSMSVKSSDRPSPEEAKIQQDQARKDQAILGVVGTFQQGLSSVGGSVGGANTTKTAGGVTAGPAAAKVETNPV